MKGGNRRGEQVAVPSDPTRRARVAEALRRLSDGAWWTRRALFDNVGDANGPERIWQRRVMERIEREGVVERFGVARNVRYRRIFGKDWDRFSRLVDEHDPLVRRFGVGLRVEMTPSLRNLLDGLLLGDGAYATTGHPPISGVVTFAQRSIHDDWTTSLAARLASLGVESRLGTRAPYVRATSQGHVLRAQQMTTLQSRAYRNLLSERERWYPTGRKIVPRDIDLGSAELIAQWHMGDGCLAPGRRSVSLATNCFTEDDVHWLAGELMSKHGIEATIQHWRGQPILRVGCSSVVQFCDMVRPFMAASFLYKVDVRRDTRTWVRKKNVS